MVSMNRVIIAGNLAKDPEMKEVSNGHSMAIFPVAVSRHWKNNKGDAEKQTSFFRVVVWNSTAINCARYLRKGRPVLVEGRLETRSFTGDSGEKKYLTQVVGDSVTFLSKPEFPNEPEVENGPSIF